MLKRHAEEQKAWMYGYLKEDLAVGIEVHVEEQQKIDDVAEVNQEVVHLVRVVYLRHINASILRGSMIC